MALKQINGLNPIPSIRFGTSLSLPLTSSTSGPSGEMNTSIFRSSFVGAKYNNAFLTPKGIPGIESSGPGNRTHLAASNSGEIFLPLRVSVGGAKFNAFANPKRIDEAEEVSSAESATESQLKESKGPATLLPEGMSYSESSSESEESDGQPDERMNRFHPHEKNEKDGKKEAAFDPIRTSTLNAFLEGNTKDDVGHHHRRTISAKSCAKSESFQYSPESFTPTPTETNLKQTNTQTNFKQTQTNSKQTNLKQTKTPPLELEPIKTGLRVRREQSSDVGSGRRKSMLVC